MNLIPTFLMLANEIPGYSAAKFLQEVRGWVKDDIFYSQQEIAEKYGVSLQCVKKWCADGDLKASFKRPNGTVRYRESDLLELENSRGLTPVNEIARDSKRRKRKDEE